MKTFEQILKRKQKYYGKTEASYEFAADEFAKEYHKHKLKELMPSDEEIDKMIDDIPYYGSCKSELKEGTKDGIEWLKNKILNK